MSKMVTSRALLQKYLCTNAGGLRSGASPSRAGCVPVGWACAGLAVMDAIVNPGQFTKLPYGFCTVRRVGVMLALFVVTMMR